MATNHTTNYNLNLWEASDKFVREEFNENTQKIDAAIKAEADARAAAVTAETNARIAADSAINSALSGKARIAAGHYIGDQAETRFISTGFTPKAVFVHCPDEYQSAYSAVYGGLAVEGSPAAKKGSSERHAVVEIVSGGFKVYTKKPDGASFSLCGNSNTFLYNYIAIG